MTSETQKKYRTAANRNRRALLKEKETYGWIGDGSGKRYRAGVYFVLGGETQKALDFFSWFDREFPDDIGEPVFNLFRALAEYRAGNIENARFQLQATMLSNLYMLPYLFGDPLESLDIWHTSNRDQEDYLCQIEKFLEEPSHEERFWIKEEFNSQPFADLRAKYIETFHSLKSEQNIESRRALLNGWYQYLAQCGH